MGNNKSILEKRKSSFWANSWPICTIFGMQIDQENIRGHMQRVQNYSFRKLKLTVAAISANFAPDSSIELLKRNYCFVACCVA